MPSIHVTETSVMVVAELEVHGEGQLFKDVVTLQAEFFHKLFE